MAKKILIVNVNWVGDVLFSTPFIRAVREAFPKSHVACLLHPRCREILENNPRIDEIIIYDEEGEHRPLLGKMRLIRNLKKKRFDTAFLLHRSFTKAFIVCSAGIKERVGYSTKNRSFLLTKAVDEPHTGVHKVEYFLGLARAAGIDTFGGAQIPSFRTGKQAPLSIPSTSLGMVRGMVSKPNHNPERSGHHPEQTPAFRPESRRIDSRDVSYEYFIRDAEREYIRRLLEDEGLGSDDRLIVMCPGGNWNPKRWLKDNFALLANILMDRFGAKIAIAGVGKDIDLANEINTRMKGSALIAAGRTSLKELAALLERADLVIANDTGPMHMSVAVGTKTIALFGPTSPAITGPYGNGRYKVISSPIDCTVPCYDKQCDDNKCMEAISVEAVLQAACEMLGKGKDDCRQDKG